MQGFAYLIREKRVLLYPLSQRCPSQKFRVEQQSPAFALNRESGIYRSANLTGSYGNERAAEKVVPTRTVNDILRLVLTDVNAIHTKQCTEQMPWRMSRKIYHAYERMLVFDTQ